MHYDTDRNLQVQLRGVKRWYLLQPQHALQVTRLHPWLHPSARHVREWVQRGSNCTTEPATDDGAPFLYTATLHPGDVLYTPALMLHATQTLETSLARTLWWKGAPELWMARCHPALPRHPCPHTCAPQLAPGAPGHLLLCDESMMSSCCRCVAPGS